MRHKKIRVLFVGGFQSMSYDGGMGGQIQACTLLIESPLSLYVNWILIDSTMRSNPPPSIIIRFIASMKRLTKYIYHLIVDDIESILIFSSAGYSAIEKGLMVCVGKIFKKKVIISYRSGHIEHNIKKSKLFRHYISFVISIADIIICQSQYWQNYYKNLVHNKSSKFVVIKNWIDPNKYNKFVNRDKIKISIIFMGLISKNKGVYDIYEMVRNYMNDFKNVEFELYGGGPDYEKLFRLIREYDLSHIIKLKGWVYGEAKQYALVNSDVLILPSYFEGMPNVILEAMACGKPVVSTNVGGIPDIVDHGISGILFKPGDIKAFRDSLITLIDNRELRNTMGIKARHKIDDEHDINKIWKNILYILIN
jgi:glycosyltransferase involved in cell wall biosynthesis